MSLGVGGLSLCPLSDLTVQCVMSVGQDVSPGKCLLLSTSKTVGQSMRLWDVSGDGQPWKVELDIGDLGGHLDFSWRARAGTLSERVKEATPWAAFLGVGSQVFGTGVGCLPG